MKLYLDIYRIYLQKKVKGKYAKEPVNFDEIYMILKKRYPNFNHIQGLFQGLIKSFDEKFYCDSENTKALSFQGPNNWTMKSEQNIISGKFIGGNTGLEYNVYDNDDANQITHVVQQTEVASVPFFFMLWVPKSFQVGVLILQRYSTHNCAGLFKKLMTEFFKELGYKINFNKFMPKEMRREYIENCKIEEIRIVRKEDLNNALQPKLKILKSSTMVSRIRNTALSTIKLIEEPEYKEQVINDIEELYPPYDDKDYSLKFFYIDEKGDKASSTLEGLGEIVPSINLGNECLGKDNLPLWDEIEKKAEGYLKFIKKDLSYIVEE